MPKTENSAFGICPRAFSEDFPLRLPCKEPGRAETIVFGLTGAGCFDMLSSGKYNDDVMQDYVPTDNPA